MGRISRHLRQHAPTSGRYRPVFDQGTRFSVDDASGVPQEFVRFDDVMYWISEWGWRRVRGADNE